MPFTPKFVDMVRNLTSSTGTGAINLGSTPSGFTGLSAALNTGEQFYYCIQGVDKPSEREVGRGTMLANGTVAREAISGDLTNFTSGTKTIALVTAAEWFAKIEQGGGAGGAGDSSLTASGLTQLAALPIVNGAAALLTAKGREGLFIFDSSNLAAKVAADTRKGIYSAPSSAPTGASGAWVRQFSGPANVNWWGAVADDLGYLGSPAATDNADAIEGALATLKARANATLTLEKLSEPLFFDGHYYTSRAINLKQAIQLLGTGTKNAMRTRIRFPINSDGIIVNVQTSTGDTVEASSSTAAGTLIDGIHLLGGGGSTGHGFRLRGRASVRNGGARNFAQDGVHIFAWSGGGATNANFGNANCFNLSDLWCFANGRHGVFVAGSEGNAGYGIGLDCSYNGCWGIFDASFLGSFWLNCHTDQNGNKNWVTNAGVASGTEVLNGTDTGEARVEHGGKVWAVILGSEVAASTTTPGTDATVWYDQGAGTVGAPAWVSGMQVRSGGPYAAGFCLTDGTIDGTNANSRAQYWGVYAEGGMAPCQVSNKGSIEGFIDECGNVGDGQWIRRGQAQRQTFSHGIETDSGDWVANGGRTKFIGTSVATTAGGGAFVFRNATDGLSLIGEGSAHDFIVANKSGAAILTAPTGTQNVKLWGNVEIVGTLTGGGIGGLSNGDKGDVVVAGGGATMAVESATPASGSFDVAGRLRFTANGAYTPAAIYKSATDGIGIVGASGSSNDLNFLTPGGAAIFCNPTGTQNSDFYGNVNVAVGKVFKVNGTQVVGARQTGTAANATDLASAIALVNDLKAKLTAHGLVS